MTYAIDESGKYHDLQLQKNAHYTVDNMKFVSLVFEFLTNWSLEHELHLDIMKL